MSGRVRASRDVGAKRSAPPGLAKSWDCEGLEFIPDLQIRLSVHRAGMLACSIPCTVLALGSMTDTGTYLIRRKRRAGSETETGT
jgi:hypothetical protein